MGFREGIKSAGGFWNNVDGTIEGYEFTTQPPGGGSSSEWVYFVPSIQIDGAAAPSTQHLFMGGADRYTISKDGQTISDAGGGNVTIGAKTPTGLFLDSLLEAGFDEGLLPDIGGGEALELSAIVGTRVRLTQETDEVGTAKRGKRKGADGKEYNRTNTVIANVYGTSANGAKAAAKATTKGKPVAVKTESAEDRIQRLADQVVQATLTAAKGKAFLTSLSTSVIRVLSKEDKATKDAVRKMVQDDEYLTDGEQRGIFAVDGDYVVAA